MGCCCCHSLPDIEHDLSVSSYATVVNIVVCQGASTVQVRGGCKGLMYIQGDSLHYVMKSCCRCCNRSIKLSHIEKIEYIRNPTLPLNVSTGLRITAYPNTLVLAAMPEAEEFAQYLARASSAQKKEDLTVAIGDGEKGEWFIPHISSNSSRRARTIAIV